MQRSNLSSQNSIKSMLPKELSKHSKIILSQAMVLLIHNFLYNYIQLWCEFLPQAKLTLNFLCKTQCNNKYLLMPSLKVNSILTRPIQLLQEQMHLYSMTPRCKRPEHLTLKTHGMSFQKCNIIDVLDFMYHQQKASLLHKQLNSLQVFPKFPCFQTKNVLF